MLKLPTCAALAAAAAALFAAPAAAATPIPGLSAHAGVILGSDKAHVDLTAGPDEASGSGIAYGVVLGADYTLPGGLFIGGEAEYSDSSLDESAADVLVPGDEAAIEAGSVIVLSGRGGVTLPGGLKFYARAGWTKASFTATYDDGVTVQGGKDRMTGLMVGVGGELTLGQLTVRAEYRYANYGDITVGPGSSGLSPSRTQLLGGVLFEF